MKKYKFVLKENFETYIHELRLFKFIFTDKDGITWGKIDHGYLTIKKGYAWNGCTIVPDTEQTYTASLLHDFGYQFHYAKRNVVDKIFHKQLVEDKFRYAEIYYLGVRIFGGLFY